jgi:CRISPR type I-E-associated protein CasB/Cse2
MSPPTQREQAFIAFLEGLVEREQLGALAALRRGLGRPPGEAPGMHPFVMPWLPATASPWDEEPYYLVAALFAFHPANDSREGSDLGTAFAWFDRDTTGGGAERRFVALLGCDREDLPENLRHAVALMRSKSVPIPWAQLLHDIRGWDLPRRPVQRQWARSFWGTASARDDEAAGATAPSMKPEGGNHVS